MAKNKAVGSREQAGASVKAQLQALPMSMILAASCAEFVHGLVDGAALLAWFAVIAVTNLARFVLARYFRDRLGSEAAARRYLRVFFWGNVASGLEWAAFTACFVSATDVRALYIFVILAGICAGAAVQSGFFLPAAVVFFLPVQLVVTGKFMAQGSLDSAIMAGDVLLYVLFLIATIRNGEATFFTTLRLKKEAQDLAASLERDHAATREAAARLYRLAKNDSLTGLANRAAFNELLDAWIADARGHGRSFFLCLIDLDRFKAINDTLGHGAGDMVLVEVARRLRHAAGQVPREASAGADGAPREAVVARLGGDEFAMLLAGPTPPPDDLAEARGELVARTIMAAVPGAFRIGDRAVDIAVSLGLAMFPCDGATSRDLFGNADVGLYAAKDAGRGGWRRFDMSLRVAARVARDIEHDLPEALAAGALDVWFQPQIALSGRRLIGLEALARWNHPSHGWIAPPVIVAAAARTRASRALTAFVLDRACRMIGELDAAGRSTVCVAVNVAPRDFDLFSVPDLVRDRLAAAGVSPARVEIEVSEETFVIGAAALAAIEALSTLGVRLAIDDFGTGGSSLAYLSGLRIDRIKIDRGIVSGLATRPGDHLMARAILRIGQTFGIDVMAEGVETIEDCLMLKAHGCATAQGFLFARPMDEKALAAWLAAEAARATTQNAPRRIDRLAG